MDFGDESISDQTLINEPLPTSHSEPENKTPTPPTTHLPTQPLPEGTAPTISTTITKLDSNKSQRQLEFSKRAHRCNTRSDDIPFISRPKRYALLLIFTGPFFVIFSSSSSPTAYMMHDHRSRVLAGCGQVRECSSPSISPGTSSVILPASTMP